MIIELRERKQIDKYRCIDNYKTVNIDGAVWLSGGLLYTRCGFSVKCYGASEIEEIYDKNGIPQNILEWYIVNTEYDSNGAAYVMVNKELLSLDMPLRYTAVKAYKRYPFCG